MNKEEFRKMIGGRIREARTQHGMSQEQLAQLSSMSRTSIIHIEYGRQGIDVFKLARIANVLGIEPKKFLDPEWEVTNWMLC